MKKSLYLSNRLTNFASETHYEKIIISQQPFD